MTSKEKQWWDPYETSQRRDFIYRPGSAPHVSFVPAPALFSVSGSFGSTQYSEDYTWKPFCRPDYIRTGTASGTRSNNPQPSKYFLMWRLPGEAADSCEESPSERDLREAVRAQYLSTYIQDYSGWTPGSRLVLDYSRVRPLTRTGTEMRDSYRWPINTPELTGGHFLVYPAINQNINNYVPTKTKQK